MGGGSPVPLPFPVVDGLVLTVRGDKARPPKDEIEDTDETDEYDVEEFKPGVDDGRPGVLGEPDMGKPEMGIGRARTAALIEPGGELVGENVSGGEV